MLYHRRLSIEPLIEHLKEFGLMGRSSPKTNQNTHSSGFASILVYDLKQMVPFLTGEAVHSNYS